MQCAFILGVDLLCRMWSWPCSGSVLSTFPVTITDKTTKCRLTACTGLAAYGAENCYFPHYILAASQLVKLRYDTIEEINVDSKAEYTA